MKIDIDHHINRISNIDSRVLSEFGTLSARQLNYRESDKTWSVGQCIHHLITINKSYFEEFNKILDRNYKNSLWKRINPFTQTVGKTMIRTLGPDKTKTFKTPRLFEPMKSLINLNILPDFHKNQMELIGYLEKFRDIDGRVIINSPVSTVITLNLEDAVQILVGHEERHINQAMDVYSSPNFPVND